MNSYEELKMEIYESGIDFDEACEIIDIMESCDDDEEFDEVVEAVLDVIEESNSPAPAGGGAPAKTRALNQLGSVLNRIDGKKSSSGSDRARKAARTGAIAGAALAAGGAYTSKRATDKFYIASVRKDKYQSQLRLLTTQLSHATTRSEQKRLESRIDKIQNKIRDCERVISKSKKGVKRGSAISLGGTALGIGSVAAARKLSR